MASVRIDPMRLLPASHTGPPPSALGTNPWADPTPETLGQARWAGSMVHAVGRVAVGASSEAHVVVGPDGPTRQAMIRSAAAEAEALGVEVVHLHPSGTGADEPGWARHQLARLLPRRMRRKVTKRSASIDGKATVGVGQIGGGIAREYANRVEMPDGLAGLMAGTLGRRSRLYVVADLDRWTAGEQRQILDGYRLCCAATTPVMLLTGAGSAQVAPDATAVPVERLPVHRAVMLTRRAALAAGVPWDEAAHLDIARRSMGDPDRLHAYAKATFDTATGTPVTATDARMAMDAVDQVRYRREADRLRASLDDEERWVARQLTSAAAHLDGYWERHVLPRIGPEHHDKADDARGRLVQQGLVEEQHGRIVWVHPWLSPHQPVP